MKTRRFPNYLVMIILAMGFAACQKDKPIIEENTSLTADFNSEVPLQWYLLFEQIDRWAPGYRPPASARALAYIGLAAYEAVRPGMPGYKSFAGRYPGLQLPAANPLTTYHWPTALNAAYHTIFESFYPHIPLDDLHRLRSLNEQFEQIFIGEVDGPVFERSVAFGNAIAEAVFDWSKTDIAGHQAYLNPRPDSYVPPVGPGLWQPTWPDFTPALFPYWGQVRSFAVKGGDLMAKPPLEWSNNINSQIGNQAQEVKLWVEKIKAGEDREGHWIAEFWSDDFYGITFTPPGRWIAIANQMVEKEEPSLERAVELYAKMGMALCDVGIAVWNSKYTYNYERPIDFIRRNLDPSWESIMIHPINRGSGLNPEFPAYPSGHSGFGGAAAMILTDVFGYSYQFTDNCHKDRTDFLGTPRTFNSFMDMAVENAFSRLPLGVHFRMDCEEGLRMGLLAGQRVLELEWK
ncbi:MAG: phosphatase PAP2 family protein [Saprospiraceae bacterium]